MELSNREGRGAGTNCPNVVPVLAIAFLLVVFFIPAAQAQAFSVVYSFTGGVDGETPAPLVMDRAGNLYGGSGGGVNGFGGVVYKLTHKPTGWIFAPLHNFVRSEGTNPIGLTIGPDGNIYGTNSAAGGGGSCGGSGCGTIFELTPPPTFCRSVVCPWPATVLHKFGGNDGGAPPSGVVFDQAGNFYGTTSQAGSAGYGAVYEMTRSNGVWTQSVLHNFGNGSDGRSPYGGVILDAAGNLYGTTGAGGDMSTGTVFEVSPSGSGWTENILYNFQDDPGGINPYAGLVFDQAGNLYGTTVAGGVFDCQGGCGTVFSLSPSNGGWIHNVVYAFTGSDGDIYPRASLTMDAAGNLYGTTAGSNNSDYGNVFKLTPANGGWIYTSLHDFTGGSDGAHPYGSVLLDASGNLYGTASTGGLSSQNCSQGCGVVWEITP